jgi:methyl-accepting chemotaxis protein
MTIDRKIIGGYAVVLAILLLVMGIAFFTLDRTKATYDWFLDVQQRLVGDANELRFELREQVAHYRGLLLYPVLQKKFSDDLQQDYGTFKETVERMRGLTPSKTGRDLLDEIADLQTRHQRAQERAIGLIQQGKGSEGLALGIKEVLPLAESVLERVDQFRDRQQRLQTEDRAALAGTTKLLTIVMALVSLVGLAVGIGAGFYISRTITRQLRESVAQLAESASEILATTAQVASGAAETATAVSQTTATVEEVKQTAQLASQKAKYVSDSAQKASQVSKTGRKSVEDAIGGMHRIQEQMESIAESIVRLSEQGQAIGEIIASVNDLAEQSNLLAVNAAIEATKAGEQGKGFAVVAQEVKSLAEQSKQATAQVRSILGDIQKATATAVLATEQGTKAVEAGVKQSAEAAEAIRQLADSIAEAAQAATQIAASSGQQMVGMDQVALAMENIKQASSQTATGTRQAEAAAKGLHDLGTKLNSMIQHRAASARRTTATSDLR